MPARSRAALMAKPPRSIAVKLLRAPDSFPMGVRAPATMTEPGIADLSRHSRATVVTTADTPVRACARPPGLARCQDTSPCSHESTTSESPSTISRRACPGTRRNFGLTVVAQEINEEQGVHEAMLLVHDGTTGGSHVQLLEPTRPDSPIGKYLAKNPPGHAPHRLRRRRRRGRDGRDQRQGDPAHRLLARGTGRWAAASRSCTPRTPAAC